MLTTQLQHHSSSIKSASFEGTVVVDTCNSLFYRLDQLKTVDLTGLDTSRVRDMSYMFTGCKKLKSLDLSMLNMPNMRDMSYMFYGCRSLSSICVEGLNLSNHVKIDNIFTGARALPREECKPFYENPNFYIAEGECGTCSWHIDAAGHLTVAPKGRETGVLVPGTYPNGCGLVYPYQWCIYSDSILSASFNETVVVKKYAYQLFYNCSEMTTADLFGLDVSKADSLDGMFVRCDKLKKVIVGKGWDSSIDPMSLKEHKPRKKNASRIQCVSARDYQRAMEEACQQQK